MKKMAMAFAFGATLLASSASFAEKSSAECSSELKSFASTCGPRSNNPLMGEWLQGIHNSVGEAKSCRQVQHNEGHQIDRGVFFFDGTAVAIADNVDCKLNFAMLPSKFVEAKAFAGRVFMLGENGKLYVMARNKNIVEVLKADGGSYGEIIDIAIDQASQELKIKQRSGNKFGLNLEQIAKRLNEGKNIKVISIMY